MSNRYTPDTVSHPGETLGEILKSTNTTKTALARELGLNKGYVSDIVNGYRNISLRMALDLETLDGFPNAEFWLRRQMYYDLWKADPTRERHEGNSQLLKDAKLVAEWLPPEIHDNEDHPATRAARRIRAL